MLRSTADSWIKSIITFPCSLTETCSSCKVCWCTSECLSTLVSGHICRASDGELAHVAPPDCQSNYFSTVWINTLWFYNKMFLLLLSEIKCDPASLHLPFLILILCVCVCTLCDSSAAPWTHPCCPIQHVQLRQAGQLEHASNRNSLEMHPTWYRHCARVLK